MNTLIDAPLDAITVVLVSYNSAEALNDNLDALSGVHQVMVVDNASTDGSRELVRQHRPDAKVIALDRNVGFGSANNVALARIGTPFALLLNPDCRFDPRAVRTLLAALEQDATVAAVVPRLYNDAGKAETACDAPFWSPARRGPYVDPEGDVCADFLTGAALLVRMSAIREIGGFDPAIFLYYEDTDLCLRLRAARYSLILVAGAQLRHRVGSSSSRSLALLYRIYSHKTASHVYITGKYRGRPTAVRMAFRYILENALKLPLFVLILNRHMVVRSVARVAAALRSLWQAAPVPPARQCRVDWR